MKLRAIKLMLAAGLLAAVSASASAQWTPAASPFPGPYTPDGFSFSYVGLDLGGAAAPAGVYTLITVSANWAGDEVSFDNQWQSDQRICVCSADPTGSATPVGTIYRGSTAPQGATNDGSPGVLNWANIAFTTAWTANGANPIFLGIRSSYDGELNTDWSNVAVTLTIGAPPPPPPANDECAGAIVVPPFVGTYTSGVVDILTATTGSDAATCATTTASVWWKFTPTTTGTYTFLTCAANAPLCQVGDTVIALFSGTCGGLTQVACNDQACGSDRSSIEVGLTAGTDYYFKVGKWLTAPIAGQSNVQFALIEVTPDPAVCGANTETEPNDDFASSNAFTLAVGDTICGTTTGTTASGSDDSYDRFLVKTAPSAGIKRNRLRIASLTPGHSLNMMGLDQTTGVIGTADVALQTAVTTTTPARMLQWYSYGTSADVNARTISVRVGGTASTTAQYSVNFVSSDDVTPILPSRDIQPGSVLITTNGQTIADTDMWLYDANFNSVGGCDDTLENTQAELTRTLASGVYYLAISSYNFANDQASDPADTTFLSGNVQRYPGVASHGTGVTTNPTDCDLQITDSAGDVFVTCSLAEGGFEIAWVKLTVASAGNGGCQPADICDDTGAPLPSAGSNTGVNEGDYNGFFGGFFDALSFCDQWDDAGNPLPSAGVNSGVNEGDYNGFFGTFFNGCP